jgi:hypothetical protein
MKVVIRAMGDVDSYRHLNEEDNKMPDSFGLREDVRKTYSGAHTWQVLRMCAVDFLPLICKD